MSIIVQKYGGSSVADVGKIGQVADKVMLAKRAGHNVVVVVSAMGKTTDELVRLAREASQSGHISGGNPPRRELDMLVSTGERVTMALLSIAIHARGGDAISFTGSQSGIITSDTHFDARIVEVRPHRIEEELERGRIVIVAGYQGMSRSREITTLGRGGSDTTAVALAAALDAEACEIYSDVDGVYSADPRVVEKPLHLPEVSVSMLQEMAEAGAKVINAQAVEWARKNGVTIFARRTADTLNEQRTPPKQTRIAVDSKSGSARAVVGFGNIVTAAVPRAQFERLCKSLSAHNIGMSDIAITANEAVCAIPLLNLPDWPQRRTRVLTDLEVRFDEESALVSVVGEGVQASGGVAKFVETVSSHGGFQAMITTPLRIAAIVRAEERQAIERALHDAFIPA